MHKPLVCITGATGNVGLETVRCLDMHYADAVQIVAAVTDPAQAKKQLALDAVEYRAFDITRPETFATTFAGVERLFLVRPPQISDVKRYFAPLIAAAEASHVRHIVFLSLFGVESQQRTPHYAIEQVLHQSSITWTFLRPSFFMQNLITTHRNEIAQRHEIFVPAGNGKTNFIDARDIGEVAAHVLAAPEAHHNKAYNLTGREAYTYNEVALALSKELQRSIRYTNPSKLHFFWRKYVQERLPLGFVLVMIYLYHQTVAGRADGYAPDAERLLGHPPASLQDFIQRHRSVWL